jgi:hypothetical protein
VREGVEQGSQSEGLGEVEVVVATVSLYDVRAKRANFIARSFQVRGLGGEGVGTGGVGGKAGIAV